MTAALFTRSPEQARADDEALTWVVRLTSGESTPSDHADFRGWRDASPIHAEALARARKLWAQLEIVAPEFEARHVEVQQRRSLEQEHERHRARFTLRSRPWLTAAASITLALAISYQYLHAWRFDQVTTVGERRSITLTDGSRVMLGADSAFSEDFTQGERRVHIARGEAFIQVAQNDRPFVVEARGAEIRDIGTAFNVAMRPKAVRVVVSEGVVEASHGGRRARLTANQGADITATGIIRADVDASRETAWIRGRLIAVDRPLRDIITEVAPYSSRKILILNEAVAERRVNVAVDLDSTQEWLASLDEMRDVHVTMLPGLAIIR